MRRHALSVNRKLAIHSYLWLVDYDDAFGHLLEQRSSKRSSPDHFIDKLGLQMRQVSAPLCASTGYWQREMGKRQWTYMVDPSVHKNQQLKNTSTTMILLLGITLQNITNNINGRLIVLCIWESRTNIPSWLFDCYLSKYSAEMAQTVQVTVMHQLSM